MSSSKDRFPEAFGFRDGDKGTHTSRTIMLDELGVILTSVPADEGREAYLHAAIEENALSKPTVATRKLSVQRLSELYALDPLCPLYRLLRRLWAHGSPDRPLLALLCSLARDPLLRATGEPVLSMATGEELARQRMTDAVRSAVGERLNDSTVDKVVRNASSSWAQSGHLHGRNRKFRQPVHAGAAAATYALALGYLQGLRGTSLFTTLWARTLCDSPGELRELASEAKRHGYLDLKIAGDIIDVGFTPLLTNKEIQDSRVTH